VSSPSLKSGGVKSKSKSKSESTGLKSKSKSQKTGLESDSSPSPGLEYYISAGWRHAGAMEEGSVPRLGCYLSRDQISVNTAGSSPLSTICHVYSLMRRTTELIIITIIIIIIIIIDR